MRDRSAIAVFRGALIDGCTTGLAGPLAPDPRGTGDRRPLCTEKTVKRKTLEADAGRWVLQVADGWPMRMATAAVNARPGKPPSLPGRTGDRAALTSARRATRSPARARAAGVRAASRPSARSRPARSTIAAASEAKSGSSERRISRARAGLRPPVETAICSSPRRSTDGMMTSQSAGRSTTFTSVRWARAAAATARSTSSRPVAATASVQPWTSTRRKARPRCSTPPAAASADSAGVRVGLTTRTRAPHSSSAMALRSPTGPPPTTRQRRPRRSRKAGK